MTALKKQRTFLATTALEEFWDAAQPILFLGDWCKVYDRKIVWEKLDAETLDSPLINQDPDTVLTYVDEIFETLLPIISKWLNKIHNTEHSLKYWKILIGRVLFLYIQTVYDRYWRLKIAYSLYPELNTIGLDETSYRTPVNIQECFALFSISDAWNLQLFTQLIRLNFTPPIAYKNYSWSDEIKQCEKNITGQSAYRLRAKLKIHFLWFIAKLRGPKITALLHNGFSKTELCYLMLSSKFKILPLLPKKLCNAEKLAVLATTPNWGLRQELAKLTVTDDFSKTILETLSVNMPLSFIENYEKECTISAKQYPHFVKGAVGAGYGGPIEFYTAKHAEMGMKRVAQGHGGLYGISSASATHEVLELKGVDYYLAWGAKFHNNVIILPVMAFCQIEPDKNKKLLERARTINQDSPIIWISTEFSRYPPVEIKFALGANHYEHLYYDWQFQVLSALSDDIFSKIVMRLRHTTWSDQWKYLKDKLPDLKIYQPDSKNSFVDHICSAKLLLVDNLNTTYLYGLVCNIPTIMFWDQKMWTVHEDVKFTHEALEKAGILHHTPESAVKMINSVGRNPRIWWENKEVQLARQQYCDYFLRISPDWVKQWKEVLLKIADS